MIYRKKALLEVVETREGGVVVQNSGKPEDQWFIDSATFEATYELAEPSVPQGEFDFGMAIRLLKDGNKVARKGWNGKGMFIYYVPADKYPAKTEVAKEYFGETVEYNPYFAIKNVNETVSTWVPSVNDCLAEDWVVL